MVFVSGGNHRMVFVCISRNPPMICTFDVFRFFQGNWSEYRERSEMDCCGYLNTSIHIQQACKDPRERPYFLL